MSEEVKDQLEQEHDEFDAAWDERAGSDTGEEEKPAVEEKPAEEGDEEWELEDSEETSEDDDSKEDDSKEGESSEAATEPEDDARVWEQRYKSFQGRYHKERAEWEQRLKQLEEQTSKAQDTKQEEKEPEDDALNEFMAEFPELSEPISKMVRSEAQKIVEQQVGEVKKTLEPLQQTAQKQEADNHIRRISEAHTDWQDMLSKGEVDSYVESLPSLYRKEAERVVNQGTTDEVIELLDQVKSQRQVKQKPQEPRQRKTAVRRHSSGPPKSTEADPDDFDSAWDRALKMRGIS